MAKYYIKGRNIGKRPISRYMYRQYLKAGYVGKKTMPKKFKITRSKNYSGRLKKYYKIKRVMYL